MPHPVRAFAVAALIPVPLIALGALFGGWWVAGALAYMTLVSFALDELVMRIDPAADPAADLRAADRLSATLAITHFALLALVIWALAGQARLGVGEALALFFAAGLYFGQVSNSNAHELIHRTDRRLHNLGKWVYISLLFGHHTSAHPKIHHRYVASPDDPNSARDDETFYEFAPRAWIGSFRAGYAIEKSDLARKGGGMNPYVIYLAGALAMLIVAFLLGGVVGLLALILLAGYAQMQLLLSDYVQHYGLMRATREGGRLEPVGPAHSWNAPHWFSTHLMLNAPRHSDHHAHPARPYPALELPTALEAPMLPYSLPAMATLALFPTLWQRVMGRALANWRAAHPAPEPQL